MKLRKYLLLSLILIIADQAIKFAVYAFMQMGPDGEIHLIGDWFKLHYILNNGMAFGIKMDSFYGKFGLTLFRLLASSGLLWLIIRLGSNDKYRGLMWCLALILGGAVGNLIDSVFYGVWLENAPLSATTPWFHGQVIDMFYLDVWEGELPNWIPYIGGREVAMLPIFNLADAAIFSGLSILVLFQKRLVDLN